MQKKDILSEVRGFMTSRAILTAAELDVFTSLDNGLETAKELSQAKGLNERSTERLLDSMVVSGYLDKVRGRYRLTEEGAYLSANHSCSVLPMVRHMIHVWDNWSRLTDTVIQGVNTERESVTEMDREKHRDFVEAMHVVGRDLAHQVAEFYGETSCSRLLDIGGGSGVYSLAFLRYNPSMQAVIFDLPQVIPITEECLSQEPERDRITLFPGDFYQDELPTGCDMALLSAIIHQNGPLQNLELYRKIYRALEPGGTLLIRDHIMNETRTHPKSGAIFALNMLVNTESGDTYTFEEVRDGLVQGGFEKIRALRVGDDSLEEMDCLVEAKKPA